MRRVFVVGCPRSGSTLIQSLLAASGDLLTFTESHFFDKHLAGGLLRPLRADAGAGERVATFLQENGLSTELAPAECAGATERRGPDALACAGAFVTLLDGIASRAGVSGWVEKTPDHLYRVRLIERVCPEASFVHVLREPKGNILSLHRAGRQWGRPRSPWAVSAKWLLSSVLSQACRSRPRHTAVFYDEVVADPAGQARALYGRLGLPWSDAVMDRYREVAGKVRTGDEVWKAHNVGEIRRYSTADRRDLGLPAPFVGLLEWRYRRLRALRPDA
jgi:hypothetical protein